MVATGDKEIRKALERGPWRECEPEEEVGCQVLRYSLPRKPNHANRIEEHVHHPGRKQGSEGGPQPTEKADLWWQNKRNGGRKPTYQEKKWNAFGIEWWVAVKVGGIEGVDD